MKTDIYPNRNLNGIPGIYLSDKLFVPMEPHTGSVAVVPTQSRKGCGFRIVDTRNPRGQFRDDKYKLELRTREQPRRNEAFQVAANSGKRLVVVYEVETL